MSGGNGYDAVIVGARCAGATLAARLAGENWRVLLVDRRPPPADVISTHILFPNTVSRLARMGVLERMESRHRLNPFRPRTEILGHTITGGFTPIDGFDRALSPRRPVLDRALLEVAVEAGAETRFGVGVTDVIRRGRDREDPVTGVVLASGEIVNARWVIGADGRSSTVARRLGLERTRPAEGEWAGIYGYWRGLKTAAGAVQISTENLNVTVYPCEDDISLIFLGVEPHEARGDAARLYGTLLRRIVEVPRAPTAREVERAELISPLQAVPRTMMRGFFRRPAGPGWALVGDAGSFKHPSTGQGIGDAVEQAHFVSAALCDGEGLLDDYERWRDARAAEHYEFSFQMGAFPQPELAGPIFAGLARDQVASQEYLDIFTGRQRPRSDVFTDERLGRWLQRDAPVGA